MDAGRFGHLAHDSRKPQRGGIYQGTPRDTQTAYVRDFLAFLGISDIEFDYAEGLAISEANKTGALTNARASIDRLIPVLA